MLKISFKKENKNKNKKIIKGKLIIHIIKVIKFKRKQEKLKNKQKMLFINSI